MAFGYLLTRQVDSEALHSAKFETREDLDNLHKGEPYESKASGWSLIR